MVCHDTMKERCAVLCCLFLVIFILTEGLFTTENALQGWVTVERSDRRCQKIEISNSQVKKGTFSLHRRRPAKAFQEQKTAFHGNNVSADWPLSALDKPTTSDCHLPETKKLFNKVRRWKL